MMDDHIVLQDICGTCRHWSNSVCWNPTSDHYGDAGEDHRTCDQWLQKILFVVFNPT